MAIKHTVARLAPVFLLVFLPADVLACACCLEPGLWQTSSRNLTEYDMKVLSQLRFEDSVLEPDIGQADPVTSWGEGVVRGRFENNRLILRFSTAASNGATVLRFTPSGEVEVFATDHKSRASTRGNTVEPYQELRLAGTLSSDRADILPVAEDSPAMLVLQGYGTYCLNPQNFDHWILKFSTREDDNIEAAHAYGRLANDKSGPPLDRVEIFKDSGGRQCEPDSGIALEDMQRELSNAGIDALTASCGVMTDVEFIAACGAGAGGINVYTISAADRQRALALGFQETLSLPGAGKKPGWRPIPCPEE